jgi:group II intron reverse transcriptase/maturase
LFVRGLREDRVSAVSARSTLATVGNDRIRALQHALYRAAKADPSRRFHALFDKVHRGDVLDRAWEQVRRNRGAAGIDQITLADVERYGVARLLGELAQDLKERRYRPLPARRVFIPKPGSSQQRPLSIPAVRDRIVQAALKIVLEPIFEADMLDCSFGFRPRRSAHDALQVLIDESWQGRRYVVETDVADCFEAIPHSGLLQAVEERVSDRAVLALLRVLLRAGVMQDGSLQRSEAGTPQGGVISPLLANVYLHRLDRAWQTREHGVLVRYADDALVMCATAEQAKAALARLTVLLAELGLEPKAAKTRIVRLVEGGEGVDFLGFHHRLVRGRTPKSAHLTFLARWPARKATQHARDRIREITDRARLWVPVEDIVKELNRFLRGWAGYFRYGNSARVLGQIRNYALRRVALLLSKKGKRRRSWAWGMKQVLLSPNHLGLISLDGAVVAPRPFRDWRGRPNATR